jgi:hypothetical protein
LITAYSALIFGRGTVLNHIRKRRLREEAHDQIMQIVTPTPNRGPGDHNTKNSQRQYRSRGVADLRKEYAEQVDQVEFIEERSEDADDCGDVHLHPFEVCQLWEVVEEGGHQELDERLDQKRDKHAYH